LERFDKAFSEPIYVSNNSKSGKINLIRNYCTFASKAARNFDHDTFASQTKTKCKYRLKVILL